MTNLPSLLKEAILEQDWSKVNSAYELLTGKAISHERIVDVQLLPSDEITVVIENPPPTQEPHIANAYKNDIPYESTGTGGAARREPLDTKTTRSRWVDDGSIAAGEMVSKNPSLGVANPVARNRKPARPTTPSENSDIRLDQSSKLDDK